MAIFGKRPYRCSQCGCRYWGPLYTQRIGSERRSHSRENTDEFRDAEQEADTEAAMGSPKS